MGMAAKEVTAKLIGEGIIGKTICRRRRINSKDRYVLLRVVESKCDMTVYIMPEENTKSTEESIWTPSFIDAEIWTQAVIQFPKFGRLDKSVEKYLLPMMDEYLQCISDAELFAMTKAFLCEHGIINTPVRQHAGKTYYFNESEIYSLDEKSELFPYECRIKHNIFKIITDASFNMNVWSKAVTQFEVEMTLDECIGIFLQTRLAHNVPQKLSPVDRLVQYIAPPVYERIPGNNDTATFDHIRMTVGLPRYQFDSWEALKDEVKKYRRKLYQRVIKRLEQDRQFKRYGIPINFLKLDNVVLARDFSVEFVFVLKEPKTDPMQNKAATIIGNEGK